VGRPPAPFADAPTWAEPSAGGAPAAETVSTIIQQVRELRREPPEDRGPFAAGGMATVHEVREPLTGRRVAMKVISPALARSPESVGWFVREAQVTAQLDHPCIVPVHEVGVNEAGLPYFTMKLVEGETLRERVDAAPPGPIERETLFELLGVVLKVCDALAFAHARGVVHADVTPSNVMVGTFGQVYLMDWGIARLLGEPAPGASERDPGRVVESWVQVPHPKGAGAPRFLAPEQARGLPPDERTDVFGVGVLVYYLLTRQSPYTGASAAEVHAQAMDGLVRPLRSLAPEGRVPPLLRQIVERAMAPAPAARYASVASLRQDLERFVRGGGDFPLATFEAGQTIVREGDSADAAYVVVAGSCEVFTTVDARRTSLAKLVRGDVFGETAMLAGSGRTASVEAAERTTLVRIAADVFERELGDMKPWMGAFTRALARRFREQLERGRTQTELPAVSPAAPAPPVAPAAPAAPTAAAALPGEPRPEPEIEPEG
jgi:serine/threonine-protein kinase